MTKEKAAAKEVELSFEAAIDKLESIVAKLESGDVPLEQAIELYQEGMKLSHLCGLKLDSAEKQIQILVESENGLVKKPFRALDEQGENE